MATNRSYETDGLDDPSRDWLQCVIRVTPHPEWGEARVLRWYPASEGRGQTLRIKAENHPAPQIVSVLDVEIISGG